MSSRIKNTSLLLAISKVPMADFVTPLAGATSPKNYEQVLQEGYDMAQIEKATIDDSGFSNGSDYPTEETIDSFNTTKTFSNERVSYKNLGRRAIAALPDYAVSSPETGAYLHIFKPLVAANCGNQLALKPFEIVEKLCETANEAADFENYALLGMVAAQFGFNVEGRDKARMTTVWNGTGEVKQRSASPAFATPLFNGGSSAVQSPVEQANKWFKAKKLTLKLYDQPNYAGTLFTFSCDVVSVGFNHNNNVNLEDGFCGRTQNSTNGDSGAIRDFVVAGKPTTEISFRNYIENGLKGLKKFIDGTYMSMVAEITGDVVGVTAQTHRLTLRVPKGTFATQSVGSNLDAATNDIGFKPFSVGGAVPFQLELLNDVPDYTVLPN